MAGGEIRISLDEEQFRALCRGEIVTVQNLYTQSMKVRIALQDIGWEPDVQGDR